MIAPQGQIYISQMDKLAENLEETLTDSLKSVEIFKNLELENKEDNFGFLNYKIFDYKEIIEETKKKIEGNPNNNNMSNNNNKLEDTDLLNFSHLGMSYLEISELHQKGNNQNQQEPEIIIEEDENILDDIYNPPSAQKRSLKGSFASKKNEKRPSSFVKQQKSLKNQRVSSHKNFQSSKNEKPSNFSNFGRRSQKGSLITNLKDRSQHREKMGSKSPVFGRKKRPMSKSKSPIRTPQKVELTPIALQMISKRPSRETIPKKFHAQLIKLIDASESEYDFSDSCNYSIKKFRYG